MFYVRAFICCLLLSALNVRAELVSYEFDIDYQQINITGEPVMAMTVDQGIPAPTIEATVGDTLRVTFHNKMEVESSIHWHGVLLPNSQDGVPYLTTPPIPAGDSLTYEYEVTHAGTYWYHSHTGLQEQRGLYGALVFHEPSVGYDYDAERVIVISDWTNENPKQVLRNLKREDDYYALKKDAVQSWLGVMENGWQAFQTRLNHASIRMGPMDISDVGYDAFLINGLSNSEDKEIKPGSKLRLRFINAGASSYFYVDYAGGAMTIIEADGMPVEPVEVDRLRMAIAETFDVIVTVPDENSYELRATSEDVTGYASLFLGRGEKVRVKDLEKPNAYLVDHTQHMKAVMNRGDTEHQSDGHADHKMMNMDHSMHHGHSDTSGLRMLNEYRELRSREPTDFSADNPQREVVLRLTGSMERYTWSFNDQILTESDRILIKQGETVTFKLVNETMMHHPLHLHGHFFRVLNEQGDYSPLKHTVNVPPFETVTIEFLANEEKDWFFHCHNLYHMKSGMARVVEYDDADDTAYREGEFYKRMRDMGDPWFSYADMSFQSNMLAGELWSMSTRNTFKLHYDFDYDETYDIDAYYVRHSTRFLGLFAGVNIEREDRETHKTAIIGFGYVLPLLLESELRYDSDGQFRLQLMNSHQLTNRIGFNWFWNTDDEYRIQFHYDFNKQLSAVMNHDSDYDFGAGIEFRF